MNWLGRMLVLGKNQILHERILERITVRWWKEIFRAVLLDDLTSKLSWLHHV